MRSVPDGILVGHLEIFTAVGIAEQGLNVCDQCDPFFLPVGVGADRVWREQLDRLRKAITDDVLSVVGGQLPPDGTAPPTCARITASCTVCGQLFLLERGMCSAFGDQWHPLHGN